MSWTFDTNESENWRGEHMGVEYEIEWGSVGGRIRYGVTVCVWTGDKEAWDYSDSFEAAQREAHSMIEAHIDEHGHDEEE